MRTFLKIWRSSWGGSSDSDRSDMLLWVIVCAALVGYMMPWVSTPGTGLSLGGYDLAEWASLHPASQTTRPIMLTSLLLRVVPAFLALIIAFNTGKQYNKRIAGLVGSIFVTVTTLLLLPPLEFFTEARNNPNYQQQFIISIGVLGIGFFALRGLLDRWRKPVILGLCIAAFFAGALGLIRASGLMQQYAISMQLGLGGLLSLFLILLAAFIEARPAFNPKQGRVPIDTLP